MELPLVLETSYIMTFSMGNGATEQPKLHTLSLVKAASVILNMITVTHRSIC